MTILLAAGERVPVDARVTKGSSTIDRSLVSGESVPEPAVEGTELQAGSITTPDALRLKIEPTADCGRYDSIRKIAWWNAIRFWKP